MPKISFKDSLRRLLLLHTFLPIFLLFVLFLVFTMLNSRYLLVTQTRNAGKAIRTSLEQVHTAYRDEAASMAELAEVREFMETGASGPAVFQRFYTFNNSQPVKSILYLLGADGRVVASSANYRSEESDAALSAIARRMQGQELAALTETNHIRFSHDRFTVYTFAHRIGSGSGYLIYQLAEEDVQKLFFVQNNEIAFITDRYRTVIATTNNVVRGLMNKYSQSDGDGGYVEIDGGRYYSSKTEVAGPQWTIYTLSAVSWNRSAYLSLGFFFAMASLLLWLLIQYTARLFANRQTRAIDKLMVAVQELQAGNMQSYVSIGTGDELEALGSQYNIMLCRLNELMEKNERLSDLRRVIEVKHLQSQFHPHFIFNVLEMLRYAIVVDNRLAQDIVLTLSRHLRYSISNDGELVMLGTDLSYIGGYMRLQQMRFKNRLHYTEEVEEAARDALVPRLMLQAVIENSIKYGYKKREEVHIAVTGYVQEQDLVIEVRDDGGGMSPQRLLEVQAIMTSTDNQAEHIGLHNLHRRLTLLYGDGYGIRIDSKEGEGTTVVFVLPYRKEEGHV